MKIKIVDFNDFLYGFIFEEFWMLECGWLITTHSGIKLFYNDDEVKLLSE